MFDADARVENFEDEGAMALLCRTGYGSYCDTSGIDGQEHQLVLRAFASPAPVKWLVGKGQYGPIDVSSGAALFLSCKYMLSYRNNRFMTKTQQLEPNHTILI